MIKPAPLTKDEFIDIIRELADLYKKESALCDVMDLLSSDNLPSQCLIYEKPITTIINMTARMFCEDPADEKSASYEPLHYDLKVEDNISYFLFEAGAIGEEDIAAFEIPEEQCPTDEDGSILYRDASSLYDYLIGG